MITNLQVNDAKYRYEIACKRHQDAINFLNLLIKELKGVMDHSNIKVYQSYKAATTKLRREQQELIERLFSLRHKAYQEWDSLKKDQMKQDKDSNDKDLLDKALRMLSYDQQRLLKAYWS